MANILPYGLGAPGMGVLGPVAGGRGGMRGGSLGLGIPKPMNVPITTNPRALINVQTPRAIEPYLRTIQAPKPLPAPKAQSLPPPKTGIVPRGNTYEGSLGDKVLKGPTKVSNSWCKANPLQCASMVTAGLAVVEDAMNVEFPESPGLPPIAGGELPPIEGGGMAQYEEVDEAPVDLSAPNAEKPIGLGIEDEDVVMGADTSAPNAEKEIGLPTDTPEDKAFAEKVKSAGPIAEEVVGQIQKGGSKGFMGWLDNTMKDDEKFGYLLAGLNSMRGSPDQNIAAMAQQHIKMGKAQKAGNRTADMLEKRGIFNADEAQMVRSGMSPKEVMALRGGGDRTAAFKNYQQAKKEGFQGTFMDYQQAVSPKQYESTFEKEAEKQAVEELKLLHTSAENAPLMIQKSDEVVRLVDSGAATGMLANIEQGINKVVGDVFGGKEAMAKANATERLEALMGSEVFPMIKQLGIGARGLDTPAERQFLLKVMAGEIKMTPATIKQMAMDRKRQAENSLKKYNSYVGEGRYKRLSAVQNIPYRPINRPSFDGFSIAR